MAETDPMNIDERRKYLHKVRLRRGYDDARTPFDRLWHFQAIASDKQANYRHSVRPRTP